MRARVLACACACAHLGGNDFDFGRDQEAKRAVAPRDCSEELGLDLHTRPYYNIEEEHPRIESTVDVDPDGSHPRYGKTRGGGNRAVFGRTSSEQWTTSPLAITISQLTSVS